MKYKISKERLNQINSEYETVEEMAQDVDELLHNIKMICISVTITDEEKIKQINSTISTILIG